MATSPPLLQLSPCDRLTSQWGVSADATRAAPGTCSSWPSCAGLQGGGWTEGLGQGSSPGPSRLATGLRTSPDCPPPTSYTKGKHHRPALHTTGPVICGVGAARPTGHALRPVHDGPGSAGTRSHTRLSQQASGKFSSAQSSCFLVSRSSASGLRKHSKLTMKS